MVTETKRKGVESTFSLLVMVIIAILLLLLLVFLLVFSKGKMYEIIDSIF